MHHSKLPEIIAQLLEIHYTGKAQIHMSFMGHIDKFEVDVFIPAWTPNKKPDLTLGGYVNKDSSREDFEKQLTIFIKLFNTLNQN